MVKNRKLSRAISDLGWRSFRDMLSAKSDKFLCQAILKALLETSFMDKYNYSLA